MFSFPLQVILSSPLPSLLPYLGIFIILLNRPIYYLRITEKYYRNKNITTLIIIYVILVIFHAIWQVSFKLISLDSAIASFVIYILPLLFYYYFTYFSVEQNFKTILIAISICGVISGLYFAYDSYSMLVLGKVNDFSFKILNYSALRANGADQNYARIVSFSRSHGLLEKHSISAAWIAIGCFSTLALVPPKNKSKRFFIVLLYGSMLLISLNFTSIISFLFIILFIEYKGYLLIKGLISKKTLYTLLAIVIISISLYFFLKISDSKMYYIINNTIADQTDLALGDKSYGHGTYLGSLLDGFLNFFPSNMKLFPLGIFTGDGYATWGVIQKGGDFGIVETLHRFGLPFFLIIIIGLLRLIKSSINKIETFKLEENIHACYLSFAVSVTIYLIFSDVHYSIWNAKSILPIFFICMSLFSRYLQPFPKETLNN